MKNIKDLITSIQINKANFEYIVKTGKINGSLWLEIERVMKIFETQQNKELYTEKQMEKCFEAGFLFARDMLNNPSNSEYINNLKIIQK